MQSSCLLSKKQTSTKYAKENYINQNEQEFQICSSPLMYTRCPQLGYPGLVDPVIEHKIQRQILPNKTKAFNQKFQMQNLSLRLDWEI